MPRRILSPRLAGALIGAAMLATLPLSGCVQYPTDKQGVVDLRPTLSFHVGSAEPARLEARVLVDGLDAGRVGDFVEGAASLRVLSGNHVIRVVSGGATLLEERVYVGDGVHRTLALP